MKRTHGLAVLIALVTLATLPLPAQTSRIYRQGDAWIEEITGSLPMAAALRVHTDLGSISVQGGPQNQISYTVRKRVYSRSEEAARRELAAFRVTAEKRGESAILEGSSGRRQSRLSADFQVEVARDLQQVKADTAGGSVSVRNIAGQLEAHTGGGTVHVDNVAGPISAETGGGSVEVSNSSSILNLHTGGGPIRITGSKGKVSASSAGGNINVGDASAAVAVETGGGSVHVTQCGSELRVNTAGGSIDVGDVNGRASLETGGGSIRLSSAHGPVTASTAGGSIALYRLMQGARAETGAGPITAEFLNMLSDSLLQTSIGDITVFIGPQARLTVRASLEMANGHQIRFADFPELKLRSEGGEFGPRNYFLEGNINGGGPLLRVQTMSSNIDLRRAK